MLANLASQHLDIAAVLIVVVAEFVLRLLPMVSVRVSKNVARVAKAKNQHR